MNGERGSSVVELIVGMTLAAVLLTAVLGLAQIASRTVVQGSSILDTSSDIRNTVKWLSKDVQHGLNVNNALFSDSELGVSTDGTTLNIAFRDYSQPGAITSTLTYTYLPANGSLSRTQDGGTSVIVARHLAEPQGIWFESSAGSFTATITSTMNAYTRTQVLRLGLREN